jgi:hypothetical protein
MNAVLDAVDRVLRLTLIGICLFFTAVGAGICVLGAAIMWISSATVEAIEGNRCD